MTGTGRRGQRPKTIEQKRLLGNPGKRPLPPTSAMVPLKAATGVPAPLRPLGAAGSGLWRRVWTSGAVWLAELVDAEAVLILCEQADERLALRQRVLGERSWRDRTGLRALDAQILATLGALGFTPSDRARLNVAEVVGPSKLEQLLADSSTRRSPPPSRTLSNKKEIQ